MDATEMGESLFVAGDAKLHGEMCRKLSAIVSKVIEIFPVLEDARPRSKPGIQALCSLHVALDKAKNLLLHCANCSKLYLAITGDSVVLKFEKARCALQESLRCVEDIVPQSIGCQIIGIVGELEEATFVLDQSEKQAGDDAIRLLQKEKKFIGDSNEVDEIEIFHQAAVRLGITSFRAALTERRALKKLIERARHEEDKRKESIVTYLLHLMRKYSKHFRSELTDETDSQGSAPCSPSTSGNFEEGCGPRNGLCFDRQLSKLSSFSSKPSCVTSSSMPVPPVELRCPISLQLMYDPVIISSGQTYERLCIEKWINDGHHTCPKTQQQLTHLCLTPNYCVKGLIASWCEHNGVPVPEGPPDSLDLNYWRLALSEGEGTDSRSGDSIDSYKVKGFRVFPSEETGVMDIFEGTSIGSVENASRDCEVDAFERYNQLLSMLYADMNTRKLQKTVEQIRLILRDDEESRIYMGANGFVEAMVRFLRLAIEGGDEKAQNVGAMALFNLSVNNERNKEVMLSSGLIPLLEEMMSNSAFESATAMYLSLSSLAEAKPVIGSSKVVYTLVELLKTDECSTQCKADALQTISNLSSHKPNIPYLLSSGVVDGLHALIDGPSGPVDCAWVEKSMAVLVRLALNKSGKKEIVLTPGLVSAIAAVLDMGEPSEQEQAVSCLLILCDGDPSCSHLALQEGVIPALVSLSVNGMQHGKEKAHKLLMLFREQRQRDSSPSSVQQQQQPQKAQVDCNAGGSGRVASDRKPLCKSASKRVGRTLSSMWKSKHFSVYQC